MSWVDKALKKAGGKLADEAEPEIGDALQDKIADLLFLHNTDADKLARIDRMGGMPMPSIAATQKDIPFEPYGDVTLIGRKSAFDPKVKSNEWWDADAYTVRAPQPIRLAKKKALGRFDDEYADFKSYGYVDDIRYKLSELQYKSKADEMEYDGATRFFEGDRAALAKFAHDTGLGIPKDADSYSLRELRDANRDAFDKWKQAEMDKYFEPDEYFIAQHSKPTSYGRTSVKLKPYTVDEITKHMKKSAGAAQESALALAGTGANRAAVARKLPSLAAMRARKGQLATREDAFVEHQSLSMMQGDLMEALRPYYRYDADSNWRYMDEAGEMLMESNRKGLDSAMREYGFDDVPQELKQEIKDWQSRLRDAPTEYFEGKPKRAVSLNEFAGAIIPEGSPTGLLDQLQRHGIDIHQYKDEAERTALRDKFKGEMFSHVAPVAGAGLVGAGVLGSEEAEAGKSDWVGRAIGDLVGEGYPESVAERISSGALPMDEASRATRIGEQANDELLYHWTNRDFGEFEPSSYGKYGAGVYLSPKPWYGEKYVTSGTPKRMEVLAKGNIASAKDIASVEPAVRKTIKEMEPQGANYFKTYWRLVSDELKKGGFTGLRVDDEVVVFDPSNIRSTDAAFDPEYTGANILGSKLVPAAGTGAAVGLGLMSPEQAEASPTLGRLMSDQVKKVQADRYGYGSAEMRSQPYNIFNQIGEVLMQSDAPELTSTKGIGETLSKIGSSDTLTFEDYLNAIGAASPEMIPGAINALHRYWRKGQN